MEIYLRELCVLCDLCGQYFLQLVSCSNGRSPTARLFVIFRIHLRDGRRVVLHRADVVVLAHHVEHLRDQLNLGFCRSTHRREECQILVIVAAHEVERMQKQ